ncbi:hypothetical protein HYE68_007319 [Fusarium pseudograminearum]|nr:hypothetical protein HYE68_007319 [Fusarium pseudograminearum]
MKLAQYAEAWLRPEAIASIIPLVITTILAIIYYGLQSSRSSVHLANPKGKLQLSKQGAKQTFVSQANILLSDWFSAHPEKPIRFIGEIEEMTILPPSLAQEIRSDKRLSFSGWSVKMFHGYLPGFEPFKVAADGTDLLHGLANWGDTTDTITDPLVEETALTLKELFTDNTDWHSIPMRDMMLQLVTRISSRVFLGTDLCRNETWLRISRDYTVRAFSAAEDLRMWPAFIRPLVSLFLPNCRKMRQEVKEARSIIENTMDRRRVEAKKLAAAGQDAPVYDDALQWFENGALAKGISCDHTALQLSISVGAIHTTTDLLSQVLMRISQNLEILDPLRQEIGSVLREDGWSKTSLVKMKLLDSVVKESQRMKPSDVVSMMRLVTEDMTLSDGTFISKNTGVGVSSHRMWDPSVYPNPDQWDGYRFYNLRQEPGKQNTAQLVSTSPDYLAFGHGQHACPGRFFASNEIKIALVEIIMKYDFELEEDASPQVYKHGFTLVGDPLLKLRIRRREGETVF